MWRATSIIFNFQKYLLRKVAEASSNVIKLLNYSIHIITFLMILGLIGVYFADKYLAEGYYTSYAVNLLLANNMMEFFFELSRYLSERPKETIAAFSIFIFLILYLKRKIKFYIICKYKSYNPLANGFYLFSCVLINVFIITTVVVFILNIIITSFINSAYIQETEGIFYTYEEKRAKIKEELSENRYLVSIAINKIIYDIETDNILEELDFVDRLELCKTVNELIDIQNGPMSKEEHFLRNYLNYAPETLSDMLKEIEKNTNINWSLLPPEKSLLHMFGKDGEYNLKFVSDGGFFEAVYNLNGILLTEENDPVNMGTYNYADPLTQARKHSTYDVAPYYLWGNTEFDKPILDTEALDNLELFTENRDAVSRYYMIKGMIENKNFTTEITG